jgi:hypothetical protein
MSAVPSTTGSTLITCVYNDEVYGEPGMLWVILHDNPVLAWLIDDAGAAGPAPVILGTMGGAGPSTDPILSPPWGVREGNMIFIPDMARGSANDFFNFIAFNNGARRALYAKFADTNLTIEFNQWCSANPALALKEPPNGAPEPPPVTFVRSSQTESV